MVVSFGVVGGGWWSEVYLRIGREMPDRFRVASMVVRRAEAGLEIEDRWGVPTFRTVEALVAAAPREEIEFLVVSIDVADNPAMLKKVTALGIPTLSQTPPGMDIASLEELYVLSTGDGVKMQVAEQYIFQPIHQARLA